jgi:hypothetical protein
MDWIGYAIGIAGIVIGCAIAYWQKIRDDKRVAAEKIRGDKLVAFLHGLKGGELPDKSVVQVNDMLARLDPPKK